MSPHLMSPLFASSDLSTANPRSAMRRTADRGGFSFCKQAIDSGEKQFESSGGHYSNAIVILSLPLHRSESEVIGCPRPRAIISMPVLPAPPKSSDSEFARGQDIRAQVGDQGQGACSEGAASPHGTGQQFRDRGQRACSKRRD